MTEWEPSRARLRWAVAGALYFATTRMKANTNLYKKLHKLYVKTDYAG